MRSRGRRFLYDLVVPLPISALEYPGYLGAGFSTSVPEDRGGPGCARTASRAATSCTCPGGVLVQRLIREGMLRTVR